MKLPGDRERMVMVAPAGRTFSDIMLGFFLSQGAGGYPGRLQWRDFNQVATDVTRHEVSVTRLGDFSKSDINQIRSVLSPMSIPEQQAYVYRYLGWVVRQQQLQYGNSRQPDVTVANQAVERHFRNMLLLALTSYDLSRELRLALLHVIPSSVFQKLVATPSLNEIDGPREAWARLCGVAVLPHLPNGHELSSESRHWQSKGCRVGCLADAERSLWTERQHTNQRYRTAVWGWGPRLLLYGSVVAAFILMPEMALLVATLIAYAFILAVVINAISWVICDNCRPRASWCVLDTTHQLLCGCLSGDHTPSPPRVMSHRDKAALVQALIERKFAPVGALQHVRHTLDEPAVVDAVATDPVLRAAIQGRRHALDATLRWQRATTFGLCRRPPGLPARVHASPTAPFSSSTP